MSFRLELLSKRSDKEGFDEVNQITRVDLQGVEMEIHQQIQWQITGWYMLRKNFRVKELDGISKHISVFMGQSCLDGRFSTN